MAEKSVGEAIDEMVQALSALPDGARATAIRAACDHLGLTLPSIASHTQRRWRAASDLQLTAQLHRERPADG